VDGVEEFVFTLTSPYYKNLQLGLVDPMGKLIDLTPLAKLGFVPIGEEIQIPTITYIVPEAVQGFYVLTIASDIPKAELEQLSTSGFPNAIINVINNDNVVINTHYTNYEIKQGNKIGIITTVSETNPGETPMNIKIDYAELEIITPQGEDELLPMSDTFEGLLKFNYALNDGIYGVEFEATEAGSYLVSATLKGTWNLPTTSEIIPFERTSQHTITVSSATIDLTGTASVRVQDADHLLIDIGVTGTGDNLRAYATKCLRF
jgi:hypothetical protein